MRAPRPAWACLLALVLLVPAACRKPKPLVRIAVAGPFTGDMALDGPGIRNAVELALEDAPGAEERAFRVEISTHDDMAEPEEAARAAGLICADPSVVAVVGHLSSGCTIAASRVYAGSGLAMITPSATAPEVTLQQEAPGWPGARVVFRMPASDAIQGAYAAHYVFDRLNLRRFAVVHDQTPYGRAIAEEFSRAFTEEGGAPLPARTVDRGEADFSGLLKALSRDKPDGVFYGGVYTEFGLLLKQARALGWKTPFFSGDGSKAPELFVLAGAAADGAYITVSGVPVEEMPSASDFVDKYRRRYGVLPRTYGHYAYEAGLIILECLDSAGADRARMVECIRESRHSGMVGTIVFDAKGDTLKSVITMTRADFKARRFTPQ